MTEEFMNHSELLDLLATTRRELADAKAALESKTVDAAEWHKRYVAALRSSQDQLHKSSAQCDAAVRGRNDERAESARLRDDEKCARRETLSWMSTAAKALSDLQATQRAWALQLIPGFRTCQSENERRAYLDGLPAPVAALVCEMAPHPIDTCDRCGERAPVKWNGGLARVCAWPQGCAKK